MNERTLLLRQVHPNFLPEGVLSSQAFFPFPNDHGQLSVYDGDLVTARVAYVHYTVELSNASAGVWAVRAEEVVQIGLSSRSDPLPNSPAHACIDFGSLDSKAYRKLAKKLKGFALARGCLHEL